MPHVDIKCYPRELTQEQKKALADDISRVLQKHLQAAEHTVSVALGYISPEHWKTQVYDREIAPQMNNLAKKPGYEL